MNDGKMKNTMTGNKSSQSCPDCKATPNQIKNNAVHIFENVKNLEWLKKGGKSLHNLPRSMEFLINLGAKIRIGKNRVSTDSDKAMRAEDEEKIKDLLEERYGIRPGQVTKKGGNTNTGIHIKALLFYTFKKMAAQKG